jgi:hypothetical protein
LCLKLLNRHLETHSCNRYDPIDSAEDEFERRALFTASRYQAHDDAEKFALEQLNSYQPEKLVEAFWFVTEEYSEILRQGHETLVQARRFLKYSYIASLGMRNDQIRLEAHENHHACLEMFTERLNRLTETNLHRMYLEEGERRVRNYFRRLSFYTMSVIKYADRISRLSLQE